MEDLSPRTLLFRRTTHNADGSYRFRERDKAEEEAHLESPDALTYHNHPDNRVGLVHHLHSKEWQTVEEILADLRASEEQDRNDGLSGFPRDWPGNSIPAILRNLAYLIDRDYAEAKEIA